MHTAILLKLKPLFRFISINRAPFRHAFFVGALGLAILALSLPAQALLPPPAPDGNYTGENTAEGENALFAYTTGARNTAIGFHALTANDAGHDNVALGHNALAANRSGYSNTAEGVSALSRNTSGFDNTANGISALEDNIGGSYNTATGASALNSNTGGNNNTATGLNALFFNTIGNDNTAYGLNALLNNTGSNNIAIGSRAGSNLTTGSNNIDIAAFGNAGEANTIRIGKLGVQKKAYMQGVFGVAPGSATGVIINSAGQLGTVPSAARFKDEIKPMDKASEAILALKPVTFRYKKELDPDGIPQFGLVAEDVEKVNPDLVVRDAGGRVNTVRYEAVNAMLLNEFLKEHRKVEELRTIVNKQEETIAHQKRDFQTQLRQQQKQIESLTAGLEKVNDQIELSKAAPRAVVNNQ